MMRKRCAAILTAILALMGEASALSISAGELAGLTWKYTKDSESDAASSTTASFETYGMGSAISNGFLYVVVQTNFPEGGALGSDSYTAVTHFSPGDLYVNVGGTFQSKTGSVYGLATTSHANVVQQAYAGAWQSVQAGKLYTNATFATGTFEQYQLSHSNSEPDDGDGNKRLNSYPSLMRSGTLAAGDVSGVLFRTVTGADWAYEIVYKVSLASLGLAGNSSDPEVQLFWVMECGNDGVQHAVRSGGDPVVPEPSTVALLMAGLGALIAKRRSIV
jgi:hypothetical protein